MKLRHYETLYLLHPDLNDEDREARAEKLQKIITDDGGKIVKVDPWPLRKLAYRVMKQTQGWYVCMEYAAPGSAILELTRNMRLDESLMKFVTIKKANTARKRTTSGIGIYFAILKITICARNQSGRRR